MIPRGVVRTALQILGCASLASCATLSPPDRINPTIAQPGSAVRPTAGYIYWRLPRTVLDVTATFKFKSCTPVAGKNPTIEVERTIVIVPRGKPDDGIFGGAPGDATVRIPVSATTSFWQDRTLTVHHYPNGTLSQIGGVSEDQTGTIFGNIITSATKLASVALGVPPSGEGVVPTQLRCTTVLRDAKAELARIDALLRNPATSQAAAAAYALQLLNQQKVIDKQTITRTMTIDPGRSPNTGVNPDGLVALVLPKAEQLAEAGWLTGTGEEQLAAIDALAINVYLDFNAASPRIVATCPPPPAPASGSIAAPPPPPPPGAAAPVVPVGCARVETLIDRNTQFREPAAIPVVAAILGANGMERLPLTIGADKAAPPVPFAQFGIPRALPIKVGIFQKLAWTYNFNEFGEQMDVSFGSAATGVKATGLLQSASSGASSIGTEARASDARVSPETARLQAEAAALKAQIDAATFKEQVDLLKAQGKIPQ